LLNAEILCHRPPWAERTHYTILDIDFQEGLRFLQLWHAWLNDPLRPARLHVIGCVQCLPDAVELLRRFRQRVPASLCGLAEKLAAVWPLNLPGVHRLDFEQGALTLTLGVGERTQVLPRLRAKVDWFYQEQGCLAAQSEQAQQLSASLLPPALWDQEAQGAATRQAIVVGAGFAGMAVAHALALRGWTVTVVDKNAGGALDSGATHAQHAAAALTPMVARDDNIRARLSRAGSLRAQARWGHLPESAIKRCGALQLQRDQGRIVDLAAVMAALQFPTEWARYVDASQASALSGLKLTRGGIYFSTAAHVRPQQLLNALASTPGVQTLRGEVHRLFKQGEQWQALDAQGHALAQAHYIVVASAQDSFSILDRSDVLAKDSRLSTMHALAGEITFVPDDLLAGGPRCIVSGDGYVLPAQEGVSVIGSSYAHGAAQARTTPAGMLGNLEKAARLLNQPHLPDAIAEQPLSGWAGWRAVLPARLPVIGPVPQARGVWVACGFASRGLTWASLAGDLIAAALNAEPLPLENDIIEAMSAI
jgi:tRNA 5-methylaminomethyl-2-thiouridine biosynthesis bifunctional protein